MYRKGLCFQTKNRLQSKVVKPLPQLSVLRLRVRCSVSLWPSSRMKSYSAFILFSLATGAGSPQKPGPITVGPYYLSHLSNFPVGGNWSTRRKPTTFGRALTILFSHEVWLQFHLTGNRTRNLRDLRRVV